MPEPVRSANETGPPAPNDPHSLTIGPNGSIRPHDHHFMRHLAHVTRARTPERNVHAKGGGALGFLRVTEDVSQFTRAALFQPGTITESLARFSTVAGEPGSADTQRDPRGFAVKFYTSQGNYDLVGNNTPVFFIRDPMKFPPFIRSRQRMPAKHVRDNNLQWDFWTANPESAHQVTWLMGDRGLPKTWRNMNGYGSHTYMWVNAAGERFWVKYQFKTDQGIEFLTEAEARGIRGEDPDFHLRDLYDAVERGEHPSWTLHVQVMPYADALAYRFNPFDLTKVWPQRDYPLIKVGQLVLNQNPENYFAQIEQAAFEPSNLVPGVGISPDKMLLGRIFAYADTHRDRIGANYAQLPVNQPRASANGYAFDDPYADHVWEADDAMVRSADVSHAADDDFGQPGSLVREVMDEAARDRLTANVVGHLNVGVTPAVLARAVDYWRNVDKNLGDRIAEGVGLLSR